jgi:ubiquinone/menaquinone biosynthesis C-methylase UbiE
MEKEFKICDKWEEHEQNITSEYGFKQLSISNFIIMMKDCLLEKGYKKILDLGCGDGSHSIYFSEIGFEVYASDIDCRKIRKNTKRLNITNIKICEHNFINIPYGNDFFDAVICTSTIHHAIINDIKKVVSEIYRVLKQKGYFIFDMLSKEDESFGLGYKIEENTFVGSREDEENIPHHYTDEKELQSLLNLFSNIEIKKSIYSFIDLKGSKYISKDFDVIAIKN